MNASDLLITLLYAVGAFAVAVLIVPNRLTSSKRHVWHEVSSADIALLARNDARKTRKKKP